MNKPNGKWLQDNQAVIGAALGSMIAAGTGANLYQQRDAIQTLERLEARHELVMYRLEGHEKRLDRIDALHEAQRVAGN